MPVTAPPSGRTALARRSLLALIAIFAVWTVVIAVTGGFDLRPYGIPFRSTDPDRAAYAFLLLVAVYATVFRAHARKHAEWAAARTQPVAGVIARRGALVALVPAIVASALGTAYGVHVAAGSDSYGYISQADLWLAGDLVTEQPIATGVPWPEADWTFAPLGYRPAQEPGAIVPVYSPGLPLLMALAKMLAGMCGVFLVVPILGGLTVWLTYWLGAQLWSPLAGVVSAALMATSPTFLFMVMNPMSDVPVSAFFLAGLVAALSSIRGRAVWTGVLVSVAILIRPNLAPLGAVFLGMVLLRAPAGERWRACLGFCLGGLPAMLAIAATNAHLYGAPWKAGYGNLDQFYSWGHVVTNLVQYPAWLLETETPLVILSLAPLLLLPAVPFERRRTVVFLALFIGGVWLSYLVYAPFDVWWYLRFLLPTFPAMLVLTTVGLAMLLGRSAGARHVVALGMIVLLPVLMLRVAHVREQAVLGLWRGGVVYTSAAEYVRTTLPANAVVLTVQHSGSIRYYTGRLTLRWDLLAAEWWPEALDVLVERGYRPYLLVSEFEEQQLRARFGLSDARDAPGSLVAVMDQPERITLYDPLRHATGDTETIPPVVACLCDAPRPR